MDLMTARVEAATMSNKGGKPAYVILVEDEFEVTHTPEPGADIYTRYVNGVEDKEFLASFKETELDTASTKTESKPAAKKDAKVNINKTNMETATTKKTAKKAPAKKAAKKVAPKKIAKKTNGTTKAIYGIGHDILDLLKKGGVYSMDALMKKFNTSRAVISFHLTYIRANGNKIERTDKGYKLSK